MNRSIFFLSILLSCKPVSAPTLIEGGSAAVTGICQLLEGLTDNGTVITGCATAEEILDIASFIGKHFAAPRRSYADCTVLGDTGICATKTEIGAGLQYLSAKRMARFYLDAGSDSH